MNSHIDFLMATYEQSWSQLRHHQDERRAIANTLLVISGALMSVAALDNRIDTNDREIGMALVIVGLFGVVSMAKCHGLILFNRTMALLVSDQLAAAIGGPSLTDLHLKALDKQTRLWRTFERFKLWQLWTVLFLLVMLGGAWLALT